MSFLKEIIARATQAPDRDARDLAGPQDNEWGDETDDYEEAGYDSGDTDSEIADTELQVLGDEADKPCDASAPVNIWDMADEDEDEDFSPNEEPTLELDASAGAAGPTGLSENELARQAVKMLRERAVDTGDPSQPPARVGRAKTRLLGFGTDTGLATDVFDETRVPAKPQAQSFPVGWLVVSDGPGRGAFYTLFAGVSQIGRGEDQAVSLNFGDTAISRANHAAIAYDPEQNAFFVGHGGKANIVRLNGQPVLSTEGLGPADLIRIGETTLRFMPLCGADFIWDSVANNEDGGV